MTGNMFLNFIKLFTRKKLVAYVSIISFVLVLIPRAESHLKQYYSGEVAVYNNNTFIGSTNTGKFELFEIVNGKIEKQTSIISDEWVNKTFHDFIFNQENGRLYVYLVNGNLRKYDITDPRLPVFVTGRKDNSYDYFIGIAHAGDKIATIGSKKTRIWNRNLEVTVEFRQKLYSGNNIAFSGDGNIMVVVYKNYAHVVDVKNRRLINELIFKSDVEQIRTPYYDDVSGKVFLADNDSLKRYSLAGDFNEFEHIAELGYDVDAIPGSNYIYFSDGVGIVKIDKNTMEAIDWAWTIASPKSNGWATGLRVASTQQGDVAVVFNGNAILAYDNNLDLIDYYDAREPNPGPFEKLNLSLSANSAFPNAPILIKGTGFRANEEIELSFGGYYFSSSKTDDYGRFEANLEVPPVYPQRTFIKADGIKSNKTYSTSFDVR